ncbi:MAG: stage III sporulation protein AD, partial [Clostridia bacterium]|nr:stage III sporulation protein AD [Clostridia bacterium]
FACGYKRNKRAFRHYKVAVRLMMLIFKIIGIGITGAVLSILIKQYKPELAISIPILTVAVIVMMCVPYLRAVISAFEDIANRSGIEMAHMKIVIKIIGIAYVCQFASDICTDAGERAIASKIELGGRIAIITVSMPIMYNLLELISDIISF